MIDAYEGRYMVIFDIPGAYLHEKSDRKQVLMKLRGELVVIMCEIWTWSEGFYLLLIIAIYGWINSSILWYNIIVKVLKEMGFNIHQYDIYMANKTMNQKQCTIVWYVDDKNISYVDEKSDTSVEWN